MGHQIEDCSTYFVLLTLISWYAYSVYGFYRLTETNKDYHSGGCIVKLDSQEPEMIYQHEHNKDYINVSRSAYRIGILGAATLAIQFLLLVLAGTHKLVSRLAALSFVPWLFLFIDAHLIRFSHAGKVCFGDFLDSDIAKQDPYLIQVGKFLLFQIISQWLFIGLMLFGLTAQLAVYTLQKVSPQEDKLLSKGHTQITENVLNQLDLTTDSDKHGNLLDATSTSHIL